MFTATWLDVFFLTRFVRKCAMIPQVKTTMAKNKMDAKIELMSPPSLVSTKISKPSKRSAYFYDLEFYL